MSPYFKSVLSLNYTRYPPLMFKCFAVTLFRTIIKVSERFLFALNKPSCRSFTFKLGWLIKSRVKIGAHLCCRIVSLLNGTITHKPSMLNLYLNHYTYYTVVKLQLYCAIHNHVAANYYKTIRLLVEVEIVIVPIDLHAYV